MRRRTGERHERERLHSSLSETGTHATGEVDWPTMAWLLTAGLAAFAALLNALMSLFNGWRENRGLKISLVPSEWGIALDPGTVQHILDVKIVNPAKASNYIKRVECRVGSMTTECETTPKNLFRKPVRAYSALSGLLMLPSLDAIGESGTVTVSFVPVRGRRVKFRFKKSGLRNRYKPDDDEP